MLAKIYLEITNRCNLSCSFCPPTRRAPRLMPREDFELFLGRIAGSGELLYFHVKGEPLLHPALGDFLALAAGRGFPVSITTNGTLLARRGPELLAAAKVRKLSVSLHSHAGALGVEEYWRGVCSFLDMHRLTRPFPVSLRLWNRGEAGLPPEDARLWELLRERYPEAGDWSSASAGGGSLRLDESVYLNQAGRFDWPDLALPAADSRGFCLALRDQAAVLADGTVVPCCLDGEGAMALGSLRDSTLAEILDSSRARAIYDGFTRRELVEPLCRTCGYRRRFSRREAAGDGQY